MSELRLESPYGVGGSWLRGNLHTHTTNSDGWRAPQVVVDDYASRGYDFLMISDHDFLTDPEALDAREMALIPGNEITASGPHLLHVNCASVVTPKAERAQVLEAIKASPRSFAVMAHPNWGKRCDHITQEALEALENYVGVEIFNGVIRRLPGKEHALDRWDMLLSRGRLAWGFAHDDSHRDIDVELGWNVVRSESREPQAIVEAMRRGDFYASTGVTIDHIHVEGATLQIEAKDAQRIVIVGDHGRRLTQEDGSSIEFHLPQDTNLSYVRAECYGAGESAAWTQPFLVQREGA